MAKPTKETLRHKEAFEYYYTLGRERSLVKVAQEFSITKEAAAGWSSAFKWQERVAERDARIAKKLSENSEDNELEMRTRQLKLIRATHSVYAGALQSRDTVPTASDFVKTAQLELLLRGHATNKIEFDGKFSETKEKALIAVFVSLPQIQREKIIQLLDHKSAGNGTEA